MDVDNEAHVKSNRYAYKMYLKASEEIKKGKHIVFGMFSDESGDGVETMLCMSGLEGNVDDSVVVIESEGGY